jgi:hypothetical protein
MENKKTVVNETISDKGGSAGGTYPQQIRKKDLMKQYEEELNKLALLPDDSESEDSEIEVKKEIHVKKERSEAQKQAFEKARKAREEKASLRKLENEKAKEIQNKTIENKLVKKAIDVKKKQIKEISKKIIEDDDDHEDDIPSIPQNKTVSKNKIISNTIVEEKKTKFTFL